MDFEFLATYLNQKWDTVILHSFGAGNIPQHSMLWQSLKELAAAGVQLINCTQCAKGEVQIKYASGYMMAELGVQSRSEEHTSELQSRPHLVCRLLLEKKN